MRANCEFGEEVFGRVTTSRGPRYTSYSEPAPVGNDSFGPDDPGARNEEAERPAHRPFHYMATFPFLRELVHGSAPATWDHSEDKRVAPPYSQEC